MAGVGTSYEQVDGMFVETILPGADFVEIMPEALAVARGRYPVIPASTLAHLQEIAAQATLIVHGSGLSIGSHEGWNEDYFRLLDQLLDAVPVAWHSEHLGFVKVDNQFIGTVLALPRTREALDLVAERVRRITDRYPMPFLLENVANLLPDPPAEMSPAAFLNALSRESGCGLLLDLYNLECDAHNQSYDPARFLDELALERVAEIHLAGGAERAGLMLDFHSRLSHPRAQLRLPTVLARAPGVAAVVFELMPEAVPVLGHAVWAQELRVLRTLVKTSWT